MTLFFYLSCARFDSARLGSRQHVQRFFHDLSDKICFRLGLPRNETVGFLRPDETPLGSQLSTQVTNALQASRALVYLLSPAYLASEDVREELRVFEMRRQLYTGQDGSRILPRRSVIVPVTWIPVHDLPKEQAAERPYYLGDPESVHNRIGILEMLRSPGTFANEYAELVDVLAEQIIETVETVNLPVLETESFTTWMETTFRSSIEPALRDAFDLKPANKLRALVIDDDPQVLKLLVHILQLSDFEAEGYRNAKDAMNKVFADLSMPDMPDLFLIDLGRKDGEFGGLDLIKKLTKSNTPASIVAMSATGSDLTEALKVGAAAITKPFSDINELTRKLKRWGGIGRNRRHRSSSNIQPDHSRYFRPVFLSYSGKDTEMAMGLRSQIEYQDIGVWYAPGTLRLGDPWKQRVETGIDKADVFLSLITMAYLDSMECCDELERFRIRMESHLPGSHCPPLLVPVLYDLSEGITNHDKVRSIFDRYHYVDISGERFIDGLSVLLATIQSALTH
ncbi:MAG TPA: TIR domain-containing protein [Pyrinomonadaceae bacterium]|nr:TIR domain-containing protein [Pyrinomonadaceae bacterium]